MKHKHPVELRVFAYLAFIAVICGWLAAIICDVLAWGMPYFPRITNITSLLITLVLAALAWPIYRYHQGKNKTPLNAKRSYQTVLLAQAAFVMGTIIMAWHVGVFLFLAPSWYSRPVHAPFYGCIIAIVVHAAMAIVGWKTLDWAQIKDDTE